MAAGEIICRRHPGVWGGLTRPRTLGETERTANRVNIPNWQDRQWHTYRKDRQNDFKGYFAKRPSWMHCFGRRGIVRGVIISGIVTTVNDGPITGRLRAVSDCARGNHFQCLAPWIKRMKCIDRPKKMANRHWCAEGNQLRDFGDEHRTVVDRRGAVGEFVEVIQQGADDLFCVVTAIGEHVVEPLCTEHLSLGGRRL